jgi:hypothetical protein
MFQGVGFLTTPPGRPASREKAGENRQRGVSRAAGAFAGAR